jgi:hypothetical protein
MATLTLLEAAKHVGKSKATLWRAAKTGVLSVTENDAGQILVDSSELFRVFQAKRSEPCVMTQDETVHVTHEADDTALRLAVAETASLASATPGIAGQRQASLPSHFVARRA